MGSGDLNLLKSWNPKLLKNRKKVWEREQELQKEEENFVQRQKELKKEKELNDLINSSRDPQVKQNLKSQNGLEWMYNDKDNLPEEKEDYLLGKRKLDTSIIKVKPNDNIKNNAKNPFLTPSTGSSNITSSSVDRQKNNNKTKFNYSNDDPMAKLMAAKKKTVKKNMAKKVTKQSTTKLKPNQVVKTKPYNDIDY